MPLNLKPKYKPLVLTIIDGWGLSTGILGNPFVSATPNIERFWREFPHLALRAFEKLAFPYLTILTSENGHLSIGTGRLVKPELVKITQSIENGSFFRDPELQEACQVAKANRGSLHLIGLLSDKGEDSHIDHLVALLELCRAERVPEVIIHLFLENTVNPSENLELLARIESEFGRLGLGKIGSLTGINFAIEQKNLEPLRQFLKTVVFGQAKISQNPIEVLRELQKTDQSPSNLPPTLIQESNQKSSKLGEGDAVIFFNLKPKKIKGAVKGLFDPEWFTKLRVYPKGEPPSLLGISLTEYFLDIPVKTAYPVIPIQNSLSQVVAQNRLKQFKATMPSKFPHLTYYFNGRRGTPFPEEERLIVGSSTSDPNQDLPKLINQVIKQLTNFDLVVLNIPNLDLAGHTSDTQLIYETSRLVDILVYHLAFATIKVGGAIILTSDHGIVETPPLPFKEGGGHSLNPVPLILIGPDLRKNLVSTAIQTVLSRGVLADIIRTSHTIADIAPTCLDLLNLEIPQEMEGKSLLSSLGVKIQKVGLK